MVFQGYTEGTKAYRLYDPCGDKVLVSHDVVFDEKVAWEWNSPGIGEAGGFTSTFVIEHLVIHGGDIGEEVPSTLAIEPSTPGGVPSTPRVEPGCPAVVATTPGWVPNTPVVEPRGLTVVPTTARQVPSTLEGMQTTLGVVTSGLGVVPSTTVRVCRALRWNRELHRCRSSSPHLQVTSLSSWMPSTKVRRCGSTGWMTSVVA